MTKRILNDYYDTRKEIEDLEKRIKGIQEARRKNKPIEDIVKGGYGGKQTFKIEGYADGTPDMVFAYMEKLEYILTCRKNKLLEQKLECEEYISSIPVSRVRQIATLKYIDGLSWKKVAEKFGSGNNETNIRLEFRYYFVRHSTEKNEYEKLEDSKDMENVKEHSEN